MKESPDTQTPTKKGSSWSPGMDSKPATATDRSLIGPTVVIKGELLAEEDLMIMGRVEGCIDHSQTVTIHAQGSVAAEIKAKEVLIEGTVEGNVYGTRRVEISKTGHVTGNVYAPKVGVLEGATFKGSIDMDPDAEAIERRFREKSGIENSFEKSAKAQKPSKSDRKVDSAASKVETGTSNNTTGEDNAEQAAEKEHSNTTSTTGSKYGH